MDLIPDPCENRLYKDSMKYLTPQSESICDRGERHKLELSWSPNPAPKRVGFDLFLSLGQK